MPRYLIALLAVPLLASETFISTQSGTSIPTNTWIEVVPTGVNTGNTNSVYVPGWETLQYVPSIKKHCTLALYRELNGEPNKAWLCYDAQRNHLSLVDNSGYWHGEHTPDGGHPTFGVQLNPATSQMMGVFNNSGSQVSEARRWTYLYDFASQTGRMRQSNTTLPNAQQMGGAFDVVDNLLVVHGGDAGFIGTSEYNPDSNTWSRSVSCTATASNCPTPGAINPALSYRTKDGKIYLFGGANDTAVYVYTHAGQAWTKQTTSGTRPAARSKAGWVYLARDDVFFLFGGEDIAGGSPLNDTWIYDPSADTWTQLTPTSSPSAATVWSRTSYDPDMDAVVMLWGTTLGAKWYVYRYRDGGKFGYAGTPSYTPAPGGQNRSVTGWAQSPSVATNGTTTYHAWTETGSATDVTSGQYYWPYAQSVASGGTRANLGSAYNSMANELTNLASDSTRLAYGSTNLWACWEQGDTNSTQVNSKMWNGSSWTSGGVVDSAPSGGCDITVIGTTPYVAYKKRESGADISVYVKKWNGSSWAPVGSGRMNVNATVTIGESVSITNDGANPCLAWTEYAATDVAVPAVESRVACYNGTVWQQKGTIVNVNGSNLDYFPAISYMGGELYLAFIERAANAINQGDRAQLFVKKWNGSAWSLLGSGAINRDANTGWAYRPRIANDGTNIYVIFAEQYNQQSQGSLSWLGSYAQRPQIQVAKYNGSAWSWLGGSLNADTASGAAVQPDIAISGGNPTAVWAEVQYGSMRQIYAKQWDATASDWVPLSVATSSGTGIPSIRGVTIRGISIH